MKIWILYLLIGLGLVSCYDKNLSKLSPQELVKSREIKKVSESDILMNAEMLGKEISITMDSIINLDTLDQSICDQISYPMFDTLSAEYNLVISRIFPDSKEMTQLEKQLMEAYQYDFDNEVTLLVSYQKTDSRTILYTLPIGRESTISKRCNNSEGEISFAGYWSIRIPIKTIINKM